MKNGMILKADSAKELDLLAKSTTKLIDDFKEKYPNYESNVQADLKDMTVTITLFKNDNTEDN